MKKADVKVGETYSVKVSGKMAEVRITASNPRGGWDGVNVATNRKVRIKSAQRLRGAVQRPAKRKKIMSLAEYEAQTKAQKGNARLAAERKASGDGQTASERAMAASAPRAKKAGKSTKDAKPAAKRDTGERRGKGDAPDGKKLSGLDAAAQVLGDAKEPLNAKEIVERMLAKGLWQTGGKTPAATIYAAITREIAAKGDAARFRKVARGRFQLAR